VGVLFVPKADFDPPFEDAGRKPQLPSGFASAATDGTRPVVASGGAGKLKDFYEAVVKGGASILLAASVFHFRLLSIGEVKRYLAEKGLTVASGGF